MSATDLFFKALYRLSLGRIGHEVPGGRKVLLLTTTGRRTGKRRTTPLVYMPLSGETPGISLSGDEGFLIAGSNWGGPKDPAWLLNLDARPDTIVRAGPRRVEVRARRATDAEAEGVWPVACAYNDHWADYREKCEREIPLVVLEPRSGS